MIMTSLKNLSWRYFIGSDSEITKLGHNTRVTLDLVLSFMLAEKNKNTPFAELDTMLQI